MKKSVPKRSENSSFSFRKIDWEVRPGGMLVQKREVGDDPFGPMIKIKVSHYSYHYEITVPAQSTFGDLKKVLVQETGLESKEQRLLFRGKEKEDNECLHMVGVKDMSKVILLEDPACKERKLEEMKRNQGMLKAYEEVAKVLTLEKIIHNGSQVADKEFVVLTELLMVELLKLDAIQADGEAKKQRRIEVHRVQSFVDTLDNLKVRNSIPLTSCSNAVSVTTRWETFESGVGSLNAPVPIQSATKITQDWELFD
ncbi:BAG family molecular chaperone regulator 4 isoform X2 [Jatropha curcas]|uniref:BAG family molecular chaperone regulator 4 isoform X2 n=1 Tax=Jatropha curcas TaxID=180498 RepID=UPI0009D70A71|nr:BAG family molecular chaperone regulator 4 isoform X2 [Jatropha curcas]